MKLECIIHMFEKFWYQKYTWVKIKLDLKKLVLRHQVCGLKICGGIY